MPEQIQQDIEQLRNIELSAYIDAEQSDVETSQIIDNLLNDSEYKEKYIRSQLINDHLQDQIEHEITLSNLRNNISLALEDLPAHFSDDAVSLNALKTEDVSHSSWFKDLFKKSLDNKILSGISVAASVMFVTLFTLQAFNSGSNSEYATDNSHSDSLAMQPESNSKSNLSQQVSTPSLIQSPAMLPVSFVSTSSMISGSTSFDSNVNKSNKEKYKWIEANPALSRQVRQYINEHEQRQAGYNLQPKVRTATYQVIE